MTVHSLPPVSLRLRRFVRALLRQGAQLRLAQTAASLAFLSMLALVPVFTIALSLLGALPMFGRLREALLKFLSGNLFLPSFSDTLVRYLQQFAARASELSVIGGLVFFATAFTVLLTIDRTLNRIWRAERVRPLARRLTLYWTFLTLGPLVLAASAAINGLVVSEFLGAAALRHAQLAWLSVLPWIGMTGGLVLLYRLVPNAEVRWRDALIGGLAAALTLELIKHGLTMQMTRLPTYTLVYGTFAALPIFLLWLFLVWMTVLGGALLAATLPRWHDSPQAWYADTPARRFERAAGVLQGLADALSRGQGALVAREFRDHFGADPVRAAETARLLVALGYLDRHWRVSPERGGESDSSLWDEVWILRHTGDDDSLRRLFEAIWHDRAARRSGAPTPFDLSRVDRSLRLAAVPPERRPD